MQSAVFNPQSATCHCERTRNPQSAIGTIHPVILAVCHELGVTEVYRLGGVQAVGALAFGTQTIAKVDKIVGPGNKWVQSAKKNVAGDYVGIDSIAGPSEVLVLANEQANPAWVAADMLSQAEHGTDSSAIVVTDSEPLARAILEQLSRQLESLPRAAEAVQSLQRFSRVIVVGSMQEAIQLANEFAAEHLEVQCGDRKPADRGRNHQRRGGLHRAVHAGGRRRLLGRTQPHAAHGQPGEVLQRPDQQ